MHKKEVKANTTKRIRTYEKSSAKDGVLAKATKEAKTQERSQRAKAWFSIGGLKMRLARRLPQLRGVYIHTRQAWSANRGNDEMVRLITAMFQISRNNYTAR